jgi:hypothetical protein
MNSEMVFMRHHCEPKRRAAELMSPLGQAAFGYYRDWMKAKRYSQPGGAAFLESRYYRSFINFAELVQKANISKPDKYIELMVESDLLPILWCRDAAYTIYLDWNDRISDPIEQVSDSINYLLDICEKEDVTLPNVFEHLGAQRMINLIHQRRLTPWLLYGSSAFLTVYQSFDEGQRKTFKESTNAEYWVNKIEKNQSQFKEIRSLTRELGL